MTLSIDFNTPVIRVPGYESKYDFAGASNSLARIFDDYLQARVVQQFHFWLWMKKGGVILRGFKWIYKALIKLMDEAIVGFSEYQIRKAIASLVAKGILIREQLHREHYGAIHALASYNRQYYYRIDYDALVQFIQSQTKQSNLQIIPPRHILAETIETAGFVNTTNRVCEGHKTDSRMSQNNSDTTFRINHSDTPPIVPQNQEELTRESIKQSEISYADNSQTKKQEQAYSFDSNQNSSDSKSTSSTDAVARTSRVEQKVNRDKNTVQKLVQSEVLSSEPSYKSEPTKTTRSTRLNKNLAGPWKDASERHQFCQALKTSAYIRGKARDLEAFVSHILKKLSQGIPSAYWDDFLAGEPIGNSSRKEWENADGEVDPKFIEYLAEQLRKGNNSQTATQDADRAFWTVTHDPNKAKYFYKRYKRSIVSVSEQIDRDRANGVSNPNTPVWTKDRPQPSDEEVVDAVTNIVETNQHSQNLIEAARNESPQLQGERSSAAPTAEKLNSTEDKPKPHSPSLREYAVKRWGSSQPPKAASLSKSVVSDERDVEQPASICLDISQMSVEEINRALADPVLNADLTPQIMRSDLGIITDYLGKITAVKEQLDRQSDSEGYSNLDRTMETESSSEVEDRASEEAEEAEEAKTFRIWYAHAQKLGYCSDHQLRQGDRWVNMNGAWESWQATVERGYSLEYLARKVREASESTFVPESDWYD